MRMPRSTDLLDPEGVVAVVDEVADAIVDREDLEDAGVAEVAVLRQRDAARAFFKLIRLP
jgi:hypothetical protein